MEIIKYNTLLNGNGIMLVSEGKFEYNTTKALTDPTSVVGLMNDVFKANRQTEEHVWLLCLNTQCTLTGVFEVSHGVVSGSFCNPREIFQKSLLANASAIIVVHNHPSGYCEPSTEDRSTEKRLREVGELVGIHLADFIIVGGDSYKSIGY